MFDPAAYFQEFELSLKCLLSEVADYSRIMEEQLKTDDSTAPLWQLGASAHAAEQRHDIRRRELAAKYSVTWMEQRN